MDIKPLLKMKRHHTLVRFMYQVRKELKKAGIDTNVYYEKSGNLYSLLREGIEVTRYYVLGHIVTIEWTKDEDDDELGTGTLVVSYENVPRETMKGGE